MAEAELPRPEGEEEEEETLPPNFRRDRLPDGNDNDIVRLATFW